MLWTNSHLETVQYNNNLSCSSGVVEVKGLAHGYLSDVNEGALLFHFSQPDLILLVQVIERATL